MEFYDNPSVGFRARQYSRQTDMTSLITLHSSCPNTTKISTMEKITKRLFISNFTKIHLMFRIKELVYGLPEVNWPLRCVIINKKWKYLMICLLYSFQY